MHKTACTHRRLCSASPCIHPIDTAWRQLPAGMLRLGAPKVVVSKQEKWQRETDLRVWCVCVCVCVCASVCACARLPFCHTHTLPVCLSLTQANGGNTACQPCPAGKTTAAAAAAAASACVLDADSPLASFVKFPMHHIRDQDLRMFACAHILCVCVCVFLLLPVWAHIFTAFLSLLWIPFSTAFIAFSRNFPCSSSRISL